MQEYLSEVSEHTGFPKFGWPGQNSTANHSWWFTGRTWQFEHEAAMTKHNIVPIDLLCVNLYPFEETVATGGKFSKCIENIDIGGPA